MTILAPRFMRGFTLIANDDANMAMTIEEMSLPPLEENKETFQPGGADGEIEVAGLGTKALTIGLKVKGYTPEMQKLFAGAAGVRHSFTGKTFIVNEETGEEHEHVIDVLARLTKVAPSAAQGGKVSTYDYELSSIWTYSEFWDGEILHRFNLKTGGWDTQAGQPINSSRRNFLYS